MAARNSLTNLRMPTETVAIALPAAIFACLNAESYFHNVFVVEMRMQKGSTKRLKLHKIVYCHYGWFLNFVHNLLLCAAMQLLLPPLLQLDCPFFESANHHHHQQQQLSLEKLPISPWFYRIRCVVFAFVLRSPFSFTLFFFSVGRRSHSFGSIYGLFSIHIFVWLGQNCTRINISTRTHTYMHTHQTKLHKWNHRCVWCVRSCVFKLKL